jgi:hypothetical protein
LSIWAGLSGIARRIGIFLSFRAGLLRGLGDMDPLIAIMEYRILGEMIFRVLGIWLFIF